MDSLTQIVLGSTVAGLAAPSRYRRSALTLGAALGTLPDLDVFWFNFVDSDFVTTVTWHRGPSHSLIVLALVGLVLWMIGRRLVPAMREAPRPWLWAILLALLTHPLLDAFTVYGTQLLWPLPGRPVMWSTLFIIDPLYTLPLLVGVIGAAASARRPPASSKGKWAAAPSTKWLWAGLVLSSAYLIWTVGAKLWVDHIADRSLASQGLEHAPRFSTPLPFNTVLWRVIVMAPNGYYIGDRSLIADDGPMVFQFHPSETEALTALSSQPQMQRLLWFTHGFVGARPETDASGETRLVVSDLRMGIEPNYSFRYDVAHKIEEGNWVPKPVIERAPGRGDRREALDWVWRRIWDSGARPAP